MKDNIEVSGFINTSSVDGPGIRSVVFVQGCTMKCKKCHNKESQEKGRGIDYSLDDLIKKIETICLNKKVTISGGEPMEQYNNIFKLVKKLFILGYNICLYTGWRLEEVPKELLIYLDYIKVGEFVNELKDSTLVFMGSTNQKIYSIHKGRELCLMEKEI